MFCSHSIQSLLPQKLKWTFRKQSTNARSEYIGKLTKTHFFTQSNNRLKSTHDAKCCQWSPVYSTPWALSLHLCFLASKSFKKYKKLRSLWTPANTVPFQFLIRSPPVGASKWLAPSIIEVNESSLSPRPRAAILATEKQVSSIMFPHLFIFSYQSGKPSGITWSNLTSSGSCQSGPIFQKKRHLAS